jgi:hypothetical protein
MHRIRQFLRSTFPLMVLAGLLMLGWGLIAGPDNPLAEQDTALWGARVTSNTTTTDSWN